MSIHRCPVADVLGVLGVSKSQPSEEFFF